MPEKRWLVLLTLWVSIGYCQADQAPDKPVRLDVASAVVDGPTHKATVTLLNRSGKTVVAYCLWVAAPAKSGWGACFDWLNAAGQEDHYIQSGQIKAQGIGIGLANQSAHVTVSAVVYDDRTAEGRREAINDVLKARASRMDKACTALPGGAECSFWSLHSREEAAQ